MTYIYKFIIGKEADGSIRKLKPEVDFDNYLSKIREKGISAIKIRKPPSMESLGRCLDNGLSKAVDGCCGVEPDGICEHGYPSFLLAMGMI